MRTLLAACFQLLMSRAFSLAGYGFLNCIILYYYCLQLFPYYTQTHNYNFIMLALSKILPIRSSFNSLYLFSRKRYINIREVRKTQALKNQQIDHFTSRSGILNQTQLDTKISDKERAQNNNNQNRLNLTDQQRFKHETLKVGERINQSHQRISKQSHQINSKIKHAQKINSLLYIVRKDGHKLTIHQYLSLFDKFVFLDNIEQRSNQKQQNCDNESKQLMQQKYDALLNQLERVIFKQSHAPQIYVRFIDAFSKMLNQYIFNNGFRRIFLKIVKKQLMVESNSANTPTVDHQTGQLIGNKKLDVSLSEVLSIENNIKLVQALLRIYNQKVNQPLGQDSKALLKLIRSVIDYLHLPVTSNKVENTTLEALISQYMAAYPKLKLTGPILKSLMKQILARVKSQGTLDKVKDAATNNLPEQVPEQQMVNSIRKLMMLQKLVLQQHKNASMFQQLLTAKQSVIQHNSFNILQQRISKHLISILPSCRFHQVRKLAEGEEDGPLWQHISLIPLLVSHVNFLFTKMPIQVLSKCDLLSASYEQYQSIIIYLTHLYQFIVEISKLEHFIENQKINYFRMLSNSYQLLFLMLSKNVQSNIPKPIINKCINQILMSSLIKRFVHLPSQLKIITIQYILQRGDQNKTHHKVVKQLVKYMLEQKKDKDHLRPTKYNFRHAVDLWYMSLLGGNSKYHAIIKEEGLVLRDQEKALSAIKTVLSQISQYSIGNQLKQDQQICEELAIKTVSRLQLCQKKLVYLQNIISQYKKKSIENCMFPQQEIETLKMHSKQFMKPNSQFEFINDRQVSTLRQKIKQRIRALLVRAEFMVSLVQYYFEKQTDIKQQYIEKVIDIFEMQFKLMKYPGLLTPENANAIGRIKAKAPKRIARQIQLDLSLKTLSEQQSSGSPTLQP